MSLLSLSSLLVQQTISAGTSLLSAIRSSMARAFGNTTARLSAIAFITTALVVACDKVPLTSPTGSTITLTIDKTAVPIGGTAQLTAVVSEASGTPPHDGTMVTFNSG